jgi:hypothetical protein
MKKEIIILSACVAVLWLVLPVYAEKKSSKKLYEFPDAMAPAVQVEFAKQCDQGLALYNIACAKCHNQIVKGKTIIPDWTSAQLVGYELRVLNQKHETGIPEENVTAEELGLIMTFLTYKKKNTP